VYDDVRIHAEPNGANASGPATPAQGWQTTETIRAGACGATQTMTSLRNWNVTDGGAKVIDADDPSAVYTGDFPCTVTECIAAITGAVMIGTDRIEVRNFLTLDGETNEITGNRTIGLGLGFESIFVLPPSGASHEPSIHTKPQFVITDLPNGRALSWCTPGTSCDR
jgi:hypothetical protein